MSGVKIFLSKTKNVIILAMIIAIILVISIVTPITYFAITASPQSNDDPTDPTTTTTDPTTTTTDPENPNFLTRRDEWDPNDPPNLENVTKLTHPISRIIVAHTEGIACDSTSTCEQIVIEIKANSANLDDIPYNFLIGGDGRVYEGRGFEFEGQHTDNRFATGYNDVGICVAFIGNFESTEPASNQIDVFKEFIDHFVQHGPIDSDHIIVSQSDLMHMEKKPDKLDEAIEAFENYRPFNVSVIRRQQWNATDAFNTTRFTSSPVDWILLTRSSSESCFGQNCTDFVKNLQVINQENQSPDINYNFLIGTDGSVFEGRGWDLQGEHKEGCDLIAAYIYVIGENAHPSESVLVSIQGLIEDGQAMGKLSKHFTLDGAQNVGGVGPGDRFLQILELLGWEFYKPNQRQCS